jgi:hypothetical protein
MTDKKNILDLSAADDEENTPCTFHLSEGMHCGECDNRFTLKEYDGCQTVCDNCVWEKYNKKN